VCQGVPCTTMPETPTTTTVLTTTPGEPEVQNPTCVSGWSKWISHKSPKSGKIFTDFEPLNTPQKIGFNCGPEHIVEIKCRTVGSHIDYRKTFEPVTCDINNGLFCNGTEARPCSNYEVQVLCECARKYLAQNFTLI
jgi:hypothetical protein